jgi:hypothetical protein
MRETKLGWLESEGAKRAADEQLPQATECAAAEHFKARHHVLDETRMASAAAALRADKTHTAALLGNTEVAEKMRSAEAPPADTLKERERKHLAHGK